MLRAKVFFSLFGRKLLCTFAYFFYIEIQTSKNATDFLQ
jgi:hypothetical protein